LVLARAYRNETEARRIDGLTRDEACAFYRSRILRIARRLSDRAGSDGGITAEDLVGYGVIGLLEAFDRYDITYNVDFSTFVEYRVRGAMIDAIRTAQGVTRRRRQIARQLHTATEKARAAGVSEPGPTDIAGALGVDVDTYWQLLDALTLTPSDGLHNRGDCYEIDGEWAQDSGANRRLALADARNALKAGLGRLNERSRQMVILYYGRECSLAEIGEAFGVTPSRVSQILSAARAQLRAELLPAVDYAAIAEGGGDEE
jgi:RNA polymerase sigma factor FliA